MRFPIVRRWPVPVAAACLSLAVAAVATVRTDGPAYAQAGSQPPACALVTGSKPPPLKPTTITIIEQAYYCIFANYYIGAVLDDRVLLAGAFAGFANELEHLGLDQPDATLAALTGDRDTDWAAFSAVYQKVTGQLHASTGVRQDLAAATITGMLAALDDNHVEWNYPAAPPAGLRTRQGIWHWHRDSPHGRQGVRRPARGRAAAVHLFGRRRAGGRGGAAAGRHHRIGQRRAPVHPRSHLPRSLRPPLPAVPAAAAAQAHPAPPGHRPDLDRRPAAGRVHADVALPAQDRAWSDDQPNRRQALRRHRPGKQCQPRPVRPRQTRMSARPLALSNSELMAQHKDLGVLPPPLPPRQAQQRHGTGDNQEDQLQAHKPKLIPRAAGGAGPSGQRSTGHPAS
jgi:hypothetical protein